jgi:hypothetical protein
MRYAWLGLMMLAMLGCDEAQPAGGGGGGLNTLPPGTSAPNVPSVPGVSSIPGAAPAVSATPTVLDTPQAIMEKAEIARNNYDWATYVSLLTPETHDRLVLQELYMHLMPPWTENEARERIGQPPLPPDQNRPLRFALDYWSKKGLDPAKIQEVALMPKSPEKMAGMRELVAALPDKQSLATEIYQKDALKRGFRPRPPGEKKPDVQVSGFIGNITIQGDRAYVDSHANITIGGSSSSLQHQTELHLTPLGWRIHLAKYYAIGLDE